MHRKKIIHMKNCHQQICKNLVLKFGKAFFGRNILQKIKMSLVEEMKLLSSVYLNKFHLDVVVHLTATLKFLFK